MAEAAQESTATDTPVTPAAVVNGEKNQEFQKLSESIIARSAAREKGGDEAAEETTEAAETQETEATEEATEEATGAKPEQEAKTKKERRESRWRQDRRARAAQEQARREAEEAQKTEAAKLVQRLEQTEAELSKFRALNDQIEAAKARGDVNEAIRLSGIADGVSDATKKHLGVQRAGATDPEVKKVLDAQSKELEALKQELTSIREAEEQAAAERQAIAEREAALEQIRDGLSESTNPLIAGDDKTPGWRQNDAFVQHVFMLADQYPDEPIERVEEAALAQFEAMFDDVLKTKGLTRQQLEAAASAGVNSEASTRGSNGSPSAKVSRGSGKGLPGQPSVSANGRSRSGTNISTQSAESQAQDDVILDVTKPVQDRWEKFMARRGLK